MSDENRESKNSLHVFISHHSSDHVSIDDLLPHLKWHKVPNTKEPSGERDPIPDNGVDFNFIDGADRLDVATNSMPRYGERDLNLILLKEEMEALLGDLAEEYAEIEAVYGERFATAWYAKQVRASLLPLVWKNICRRLQEWAVKWLHRPSS